MSWELWFILTCHRGNVNFSVEEIMERLPDLTNVTQNELDQILNAANAAVGFRSASLQPHNTGASRLRLPKCLTAIPLTPPQDILSGTPWTRGNMPRVSHINLEMLQPTSFLDASEDFEQFRLLYKR
jgi:hypothetical protein